jgi:glycosyltransferase involved in cell wall biosynthesis
MQISAVIITFNEEKNIGEAIRSVDWADEILVVDSESADKTREIAKSLGARVLNKSWEGFSSQKKFANEKATHEWIFSLDADERVSENLKNEILALKSQDPQKIFDGYKIPRLSFYMNQPIRHSGWYPDWQLRFFNRNKGIWKEVLVHESFQLNPECKTGSLKNDILHYSVENAAHHHKMIGERYAPLSAQQMFENGKRTSKLKIYSVGFTTFWQVFILKGGFLDGLAGFCIASFAAHHSFLKHLILWELQNGSKS